MPAWKTDYILYKVGDEITYPFPNFNGATIEIWEWMGNFIPHLTGYVITYPCWDYKVHPCKWWYIIVPVNWVIIGSEPQGWF